MDRLAIAVLLASLVATASCTLSREGTLPGTGGSGVSTSGGGSGAAASGTGGGGGSAGTTGSCGLGFECVADPALGDVVRAVIVPFGLCPTGWQDDEVFFDGIDPGCGSCSCQSPQGGSCAPGSVTRYSDGGCAAHKDGPSTPSDGSCVDVAEGDPTQARGYIVALSTATGGSCEPGTPAKPPVDQIVICRLEHPIATGCPEGETCVPAGNEDTGSACVLIEDSAICPAELSQATVLDETANDTRTCSCLCGSASGTCSGAHLDLNDTWNCGSSVLATVQANGNCANVSNANGHDGYLVEAGTWTGTSCSPIDNHSGGVTFGGRHTLCCP